MCAAGRDSLFVNARVHLPGSKGRAAACGHTITYIATRVGADASPTEADLRRAELARRMALAGYYAERPGSTALFDQDGAVPLREARARLAGAEGAVCTWVISVRREEAGELRLDDKAQWQAWCRRELAPALAVAMGVPESSVRWVAAEHENAENSKHVHVISWSSDGSFSSVMPKPRLERARAMMTDAALAPARKLAVAERDLARTAAVDAIRSVSPAEVAVGLPPTGRISYAHLRRWHPGCAEALREELSRLSKGHPGIAESEARYRAAVERCADLKGLIGSARDRYLRDAVEELESRKANALLRVVAPDRTEAPKDAPARIPAPSDGPSKRRLAERRLMSEIAACTGKRNLAEASCALREGRPMPVDALRSCPSYRRAVKRAPGAAARAAASVLQEAVEADGGRDVGEEAGEAALRILAKAAGAALRAAALATSGGTGIAKNITKGVTI